MSSRKPGRPSKKAKFISNGLSNGHSNGDSNGYSDNIPFVVPEVNKPYFDLLQDDNTFLSVQKSIENARLYHSLSLRPMTFLHKSLTYMIHKQLPAAIPVNDNNKPTVIYETTTLGTFSNHGFVCIFCTNLDCGCIQSLAAHYQHCHDRFDFVVSNESDSYCLITMSLNYNPEPLSTTLSIHNWSFSHDMARHVPTGRALITDVLVSPTKRILHRYTKDCHDYKDFPDNRLCIKEYYHSRTGMRIRAGEFDEDSETEEYEEWVKVANFGMIDSFSDVNEGEKQAMILWNGHFMQRKNKIYSDKTRAEALKRYIQDNKTQIMKQGIRRNILLQMCSLHKLSLIDTATCFELQTFINSECAEIYLD